MNEMNEIKEEKMVQKTSKENKNKYEYNLKMFLESNDPMDYFTFIEAFNDFVDHINKHNKGLGLKRTGGSWLKTYDPKKKQQLKMEGW